MGATAENVIQGAVVAERSSPAYQAHQILHFAFTLAPILAGADKFFHFLCKWDQSLAPWVVSVSPFRGHTLMLTAGIVKIAAGILVAVQPRIESLLVAAYLGLIIVNLVTMGAYLDVLAPRLFPPVLALAILATRRPTEDHSSNSCSGPALGTGEPELWSPKIQGEPLKFSPVISERIVALYLLRMRRHGDLHSEEF